MPLSIQPVAPSACQPDSAPLCLCSEWGNVIAHANTHAERSIQSGAARDWHDGDWRSAHNPGSGQD